MLSEIEEMEFFIGNFDFNYFAKNSLLQNAVFKKIENIGETVRVLPERVKDEAPEIPWNIIADTRNFLVHEYFEIKEEEIWNIVKKDIPLLKKAVLKILNKF